MILQRDSQFIYMGVTLLGPRSPPLPYPLAVVLVSCSFPKEYVYIFFPKRGSEQWGRQGQPKADNLTEDTCTDRC